MKILGCKIVSVTRGTRTLKDAVDSAFEEYLVSHKRDGLCCFRSVAPAIPSSC